LSLSPQSLDGIDQPRELGPSYWGYAELGAVTLLAIVSLLVLTLLANGAAQAYKLVTGSKVSLTEGPTALAAALFMQALWWALIFGAIRVVVVVRHGWDLLEGLGWRRFRPPWTLFFSAGIALAFMAGIVSNIIPMPEEPLPFEALLETREAMLAMGVFGVLIAPPVEELVFRGFLFPVLERKHGGLVAVGGTAAVFSVLHAQQYGNHWQILLILFLVGATFGWMRLTTGSTIPSTIAHATYNGTLFLGLWFVDEEMIEKLEQMEATFRLTV